LCGIVERRLWISESGKKGEITSVIKTLKRGFLWHSIVFIFIHLHVFLLVLLLLVIVLLGGNDAGNRNGWIWIWIFGWDSIYGDKFGAE
jgi:hypothetical protein